MIGKVPLGQFSFILVAPAEEIATVEIPEDIEAELREPFETRISGGALDA